VRLGLVSSGFQEPILATSPRGDRRVFVVEKAGVVRIVVRRRVLRRPFLDLRRHVGSKGAERGMLGLAFHPRFRQNRRLFVSYTDHRGSVRVAEFRAAGNRPRKGSARQVMAVPHPGRIHNGGDLAFGPDGYLYVSVGDAGPAGDPRGNAQSLRTRLGKILRIDVDRLPSKGPRRYVIPRTNPFVGYPGARPEIYHRGLRNPWRFSFDRVSGDLWIGDVGQNLLEEIDFLPAGAPGGANFGWNLLEGRRTFRPRKRRDLARARMVAPVTQYLHGTNGCSVIGGYVYRGTAVAALVGRYVFGDYCSGRVWMMTAGPHPGRRIEITGWLGRRLSALTSFGEDGRGELLAAAGSSVYRFVRPGRSPRVQTSFSVSRGAGAGGLMAVPEPRMLVTRFAGPGSNRR
jgi:glucose/arabinose dehydrogenase